MGMDLFPKNGGKSLSYNWSGWSSLQNLVNSDPLITRPVNFAGSNDGDVLSAAACRRIAESIERHVDFYNDNYGGVPKELGGYGPAPALEHAKIWRESGGMRQW